MILPGVTIAFFVKVKTFWTIDRSFKMSGDFLGTFNFMTKAFYINFFSLFSFFYILIRSKVVDQEKSWNFFNLWFVFSNKSVIASLTPPESQA